MVIMKTIFVLVQLAFLLLHKNLHNFVRVCLDKTDRLVGSGDGRRLRKAKKGHRFNKTRKPRDAKFDHGKRL